MASEIDLETLTRPDGIVPVDVETTAALVRMILRQAGYIDELKDRISEAKYALNHSKD